MPQVRESSAATVHAKAQQKYLPRGTTPDSRVPILLGRQGQDVFHFPGLEEPPVGHPSSLYGGRGSNCTNGDSSTSWTGARPTGPTSASGPCGSSMAGTGRRTLTRNPKTPPREGSLGGAPMAARRCCSPHHSRGVGVNAAWTVVAGLARDPGWSPHHRTTGTSRRSPGPVLPRSDRGEVTGRLPDP